MFNVPKGFDQTMAISPDGRTLAVGGQGAGLWDLATGRPKRILDGGSALVLCLVFSPGGESLMAARQNQIRVWNAETGRDGFQWTALGSVLFSVAYSPDNRWLAWADHRGLVEIWDHANGYAGKILTGQGRVWCATFSPDCRTLATASRDGSVKLWDIALDKDRYYLLTDSEDVHSIAFSSDGRTLSAAGEQGTVWTWETKAAKRIATKRFPLPGRIAYATLSADASTLATLGRDRSCQVWDLEMRRRILSIEDATGGDRVQLSPDGKHLASIASGNRRDESRIRVWSLEVGRESLVDHPGPITGWAFSPDRHRLAMAYSSRGSPILADWASGHTRSAGARGHFGGTGVLEYSADGQTLATGGEDGTIKLWDVETLEEGLTLHGPRGNAIALSFSPDGRTLASIDSEGSLAFWDLATVESGMTLAPVVRMQDVRFSPDRSALATIGVAATGRRVVYLWPAPRTN